MARKDKASDDPNAVGALLRLLRHGRQIGVTDMAKKMGLSKGYISGIENGNESASQAVIRPASLPSRR